MQNIEQAAELSAEITKALLKKTEEIINDKFGPEYSKKNPALTCAVLKTQSDLTIKLLS